MAEIERRYPDEVAVVGVHSAKFPTERGTHAIGQAMARYGVSHPVVNDAQFRVWQTYAVRAWPTLMFVDPAGRVLGQHAGEFDPAQLAPIIDRLIGQFDEAGLIDRRPLGLVTMPQAPPAVLLFPGKVRADAVGGRLFIADSGHHRILIASLDGEIQVVIGGGESGLVDGAADQARFTYPQGMALDGNSLYVADTGNHALRRISLESGSVETVAGTGRQAMGWDARQVGGPGRETELSSPWDVCVVDGRVIVAMAGTHQLWRFDPGSGEIHPWVGSGREGLQDGPADSAQLAQPSGLAWDGADRLFFADSEASAIRFVELPTRVVRTVVGTGLFDFGDVDAASRADVRLQHPLDVCWADGETLVADSYNHKIKRVLPASQSALTLVGTGQAGFKDGPLTEAQFDEPGGLSLASQKLFVADTNNHAIRLCDLTSRQVSTLTLRSP